MKRVVVGLSGGVDSSVAAYLLKEEGYDVLGVFMKNWHDTEVTISDECPWEEDSKDALLVADKLGIPFHTIDLSKPYLERIVNYMFKEYEAGRTPNPDVLCNREIKFDLFLDHAKKLGADYVATGHYCRRKELSGGADKNALFAGLDANKDQSYFLCQINQEQLSKALFPIGELQKSEVREIAKEQDLVTAEKRDSQGLCFIGKVKLPDFLKQQLKEKQGNVIEIPADWDGFNNELDPTEFYRFKEDDGRLIGQHQGAHFYTVGQRKGLNIGGYSNPLFILQVNTKTNSIYVGEGEDHPGLLRKGLFIPRDDIHWLRKDLELAVGESKSYQMRIRYRQPLFQVALNMQETGLKVVFQQNQKAVTPGQFAVWYENEELIGSGVIE
ncbi:MAG: tRNA 2-thiouridine(34) synthase MnmA [Bacteroidia bacterium]